MYALWTCIFNELFLNRASQGTKRVDFNILTLGFFYEIIRQGNAS
jgi:hypothetical protein